MFGVATPNVPSHARCANKQGLEAFSSPMRCKGTGNRRIAIRRTFLCLLLLAALPAVMPLPVMAQTELTVLGGATGADVFCLQAGNPTTGTFVGTFLQTGPGAWEERSKAGTFKFEEKNRDDLMVELSDADRSTSFQFNFVARMVKDKSSKSKTATWTDRNVILNATDKATSDDCVAYATRSKDDDKSAGDPGPGTVVQYITIAPRTRLDIKPGTNLTATSGPPCPGNPGFFLCPNKFNCAPAGGVCCPGAGTCNAGTFCDLFVAKNCIVPGNPRFCPGTGNVKTGISLHCPPGKSCGNGNMCN